MDLFTIRAVIAKHIQEDMAEQVRNGLLPLHIRQTLEHTLDKVDWLDIASRYFKAETVKLELSEQELEYLVWLFNDDRLGESRPPGGINIGDRIHAKLKLLVSSALVLT